MSAPRAFFASGQRGGMGGKGGRAPPAASPGHSHAKMGRRKSSRKAAQLRRGGGGLLAITVSAQCFRKLSGLFGRISPPLAEGRRRGALTSSPELGHQLGLGGGRGGPTRSTEGGSHQPPSKKIKKSSLRALLPFLGARRPRGSRKKEGRLEKSVAPACQRRRWFFFLLSRRGSLRIA